MKKTPVRDIVPAKMTSNELIKTFAQAGGFTAPKLATGIDIIEQMVTDKECLTFLSFPACLCATGVRGVIREIIKRKLVDVIITTAGTLDHDLARVWKPYYPGTFMADDRELHRKGINRLGNVFIPMESYGTILEKKLQPMFTKMFQQRERWSTKDMIWECGKQLQQEPHGEEALVYWAWKNKIPIYVPGITDGAFGSQLWMVYQTHRSIAIDLFQDEQELSDLVFNAKKTGALIVGGGISKHHTIWWNQFTGGLDYAVYVTTAVEYDGSLSGAQTREAVSWGKITEQADSITIEGDASVLLPLMVNALLERL